MRILCAPAGHPDLNQLVQTVVLYAQPQKEGQGSAGDAVFNQIRKHRLQPASRAWDLLSIALSVVAADNGVERKHSPDGWTRIIELRIAVADAAFWNKQRQLIENLLRFLTTDIWSLDFAEGGLLPTPLRDAAILNENCVALLSGGVDSLIGALDLVDTKQRPYLVSQVADGDKQNQAFFAAQIAGNSGHLQLNHNADIPGSGERSQRSRSIVFFAYGVLAATSLADYQKEGGITLYASENGLISINPPLTPARLGSLSTRTTHPVYLNLLQQLLDAAGLRVTIKNPYQFKTKGEMLAESSGQDFLIKYAHSATSCGRYGTFGFKHCGRCMPCLIRRAAFYRWGENDKTKYVYARLGKNDSNHAGFDDVRAAAMAVATMRVDGIDAVLGASLSSPFLSDPNQYAVTAARGLTELGTFFSAQGVK
jgi:hypothetical protein